MDAMNRRPDVRVQVLAGRNPEAERQFDLDFWFDAGPDMRIRAVLDAADDYWRIKGVPPQRLRRVLRIAQR